MSLRMALFISLAAAASAGSSHAQEVVTGKGPALKFDLGSGIFLNEHSTLSQEWTVVNDPDMPAQIDTTRFKGVKIGYARDYYARAEIPIIASAKLSAIRVQLVPIDVWNEVGRTMGMSEIADIEPGPRTLEGQWRIFSETETSEMQKFVVFIRQARLEDGTVVSADINAVMKEIRKLNETATEEDITPQPKEP